MSDAQADLRALNAAVTGIQLEAVLERGCLTLAKVESLLEQTLRGAPSSAAAAQARSQSISPAHPTMLPAHAPAMFCHGLEASQVSCSIVNTNISGTWSCMQENWAFDAHARL